MNIQPNLRVSKAAFIALNATEEERCELVGGRVIMMPRPSRAHGKLVTKLVSLLLEQLDPKQWDVIAEFGLDAGPDTLRYPDVVVDRAAESDSDYTALEPALLMEVLSPSSVETDLGDKAAEYCKIPSVLAYIVLSQDEPKAWVYARTDTGMSGPAVFEGTDAKIQIAPLCLDLLLGDIYAGIKMKDSEAKGRP